MIYDGEKEGKERGSIGESAIPIEKYESEIESRDERCASSNGTRVLSSLTNALRRVFVHA